MRILIIKKDDGAILSKYNADEPNQGSYGGPWGNADYCEHRAVPEGMDEDCLNISIDEESGEIIIEADEAAEAAKAAAAEEAAWVAMRAERDQRLKDSDFTQLSDAPLTEPKKAEWAAYRQDLRDLPEETEDPANPEWPAEPAAE
jgi:hypothetical protein